MRLQPLKGLSPVPRCAAGTGAPVSQRCDVTARVPAATASARRRAQGRRPSSALLPTQPFCPAPSPALLLCSRCLGVMSQPFSPLPAPRSPSWCCHLGGTVKAWRKRTLVPLEVQRRSAEAGSPALPGQAGAGTAGVAWAGGPAVGSSGGRELGLPLPPIPARPRAGRSPSGLLVPC